MTRLTPAIFALVAVIALTSDAGCAREAARTAVPTPVPAPRSITRGRSGTCAATQVVTSR